MGSSRERSEKRRRLLGWLFNKTNSTAAAWISYLSLVIISVLFSVFYLQSFFYLATILLLCLPVLSFNVARYALTRLNVTVSLSSSSLTLNIDNRSLVPVSDAHISLSLSSRFYGGEESVIHSIPIKARKTNTLNFPVKVEKYGIYEALATDLKIYDPLHLFIFKKDVHEEAALTILPDTKPVQKYHEITYEEGFDEFTDTGRKGNASSNVTDIREYRPGDRLSRIHWKLTEKLDTLIVKENEATSSNEFIVLLELYQPTLEECEADPALTNTLNLAIEEAWAVSLELIRAGEPFIFMFYNEAVADFTQMRIHSIDELTEIMTQAFYSGAYDTADLALTVYNKAQAGKGTLIHVK